MAGHDATGERPLRMGVETLRGRQRAGERTIVVDVRGQKDWDSSDVKIPGALRASPDLPADPNWPRDRLIVAY